MKCNWNQYNKSLINRSNINFWFSEERMERASWYKGCKERRLAVKLNLLLGGDKAARSIWSKLTGYNQRNHIEGLLSRWKRMLGETLRSKLDFILN